MIAADEATKTRYEFWKRIFDITNSLLALLVLGIPLVMIACIIKLSDGGTVFYRSQRIGQKGKPFWMYKFRTMRMNADALSETLTPEEFARLAEALAK